MCRAHDIMFLKNQRFANVRFPDMSEPETLERHFGGSLAPAALSFLK